MANSARKPAVKNRTTAGIKVAPKGTRATKAMAATSTGKTKATASKSMTPKGGGKAK